MKNRDKTKEQLIDELAALRQRVAELEAADTDRVQAEEQLRRSEERYRTLYESSRDGIVAANLESRITECNQPYAEMLGYSREELKRLRHQKITPSKWHAFNEDVFREVMERGYSYEFEQEYIRKDGKVFPVSLRTWRIDDETGNPVGMYSVVRDITERKRAEEALRRAHDDLEVRVQERTAELARANEALRAEIIERKRAEETIRQLAHHDALTGLPNRRLFNDRLNLALAYAHRNQQNLAVMLLDLDHFKDVNDTLGHGVGDQLLQAVGDRLTSLLRRSDTVARMGGDEFMLLLPEIAQVEDAAQVAAKILEAFRKPFVCDGHEIHTTTSIGIALYPNHGEDVDTLMKNADTAMYRAKDQGRDSYQRYTPAMKAKALE
jgi:diguanylate cyclase (GGDEF)-like protein/PAS domain S-box-containing protein